MSNYDNNTTVSFTLPRIKTFVQYVDFVVQGGAGGFGSDNTYGVSSL